MAQSRAEFDAVINVSGTQESESIEQERYEDSNQLKSSEINVSQIVKCI